MVDFDFKKNKEGAERAISGINKICALIDIEDVSPKFGIAEEIGRKVTKNTYLCPCGALTAIEKRQDTLERIHSISISSKKCGL